MKEAKIAGEWRENAWYRSTGAIWPLGVPIGQSWLELGALLTAIWQYKVTTFVELGCEQGGLSAVMAARTQTVPGFRYLGVELFPQKLDAEAVALVGRSPNAELLYADCFVDSTVQRVKDVLAASDGPAFVFCDNGNKPREFELYSQVIRSGDLIAAHDYATEIGPADLQKRPADIHWLQDPWLEGTCLAMFRRQ